MPDFHLNADGPHSAAYTKQVADALPEAVRVLNRATATSDGVPNPSTAYDVLGALYAAAAGMDQLLRQLDAHLVRFDCDDLADSVTGNPALTLGAARGEVADARQDAANLARHLGHAFNNTSGLYLREGGQ